ncbi:MAG: transglutaminase domain-containing protein [Deltaproteobacteria bacterium]|nr:transglutaminase domain-containing protein [Deltaproteobacteria bacterium]
MKGFWIGGILCAVLFATLFSIRLELFDVFNKNPQLKSTQPITSITERDVWMNIFQRDRKIGFSYSTLRKMQNGYWLQETVFIRINTLGMAQNLRLLTKARLLPDFSLSSFDFHMNSSLFWFHVNGFFSKNYLKGQLETASEKKNFELNVKRPIYLFSTLVEAALASDLQPADQTRLFIFDPASMEPVPVEIKLAGTEEIYVMGQKKLARKVNYSFKGFTQTAWIGKNGEILRESGFLGLRLERTTRAEALDSPRIETSEDLTKLASVPTNRVIHNPGQLQMLSVRIDGIPMEGFFLDGGRQVLDDNMLTVTKESLEKPRFKEPLPADRGLQFLKPSALIQSDHAKIRALAASIVNPTDRPVEKAKKLLSWVYRNIQKRPVLSIPDALSTLKHKMGDCNEHAVLLAALSRAAGIPAKIEVGLTYLNKRFYYHAWNLLYTGQWVTADAAMGQIPADVTHLRFFSGNDPSFLDLVGMIDRVKITVVGMSG